MTAAQAIALLRLEPLPGEGGFFRQTFESIPMTAIYYLVTPQSFSTLHRLEKVEIFHFYSGDPVELVQFDEAGKLSRHVMGPDLERGHEPQVVVPPGRWQGTRLVRDTGWALLGCSVSPGFMDGDSELGNRAELLGRYPQLADWITRYTQYPDPRIGFGKNA